MWVKTQSLTEGSCDPDSVVTEKQALPLPLLPVVSRLLHWPESSVQNQEVIKALRGSGYASLGS